MDIKYIPADPTNYSGADQRTGVSAIVLHHMAGVMSSEQCGRIFQTPNRGASAQYGIGVDGDVARYMDEKCVAWAVGNWPANCSTISIECSNSSTGGDWPVSDTTIKSAIELVADIAKRNGIGKLVVGQTLRKHNDFSATTCPGPYLTSKMQYIADEANKLLGEQPSVSAPEPERKDLNAIADEVIAGQWGNGADRVNRLREAGYDPDAVQALVNAKMGLVQAPQSNQDLNAVADAVLRGDYGNGDERVRRLQEAGYNYDEVQAVVNAKLGFSPQSAPQQAGPASIPIKVGDVVTPVGWVDYNGTPLVKTRSFYYVSELSGDRAVLRADSMSGGVYAAVKVNNLRKA